MGEKGGAHPLNSNICASCFSPPDGMPESSMSNFPDFDDNTLVEGDYSASHGQTRQSAPPQ